MTTRVTEANIPAGELDPEITIDLTAEVANGISSVQFTDSDWSVNTSITSIGNGNYFIINGINFVANASILIDDVSQENVSTYSSEQIKVGPISGLSGNNATLTLKLINGDGNLYIMKNSIAGYLI